MKSVETMEKKGKIAKNVDKQNAKTDLVSSDVRMLICQ